jgi:hypothetical protein
MTLYVIILAIRRKYNMNTELSEDIYIANISKKETYTPEEKKFILDRLNNERLLKQRSKEESLKVTKEFSQEEKNDILKELNNERLRVQKREEMRKKRVDNKEIYKFANKEYYKFVNMEREYYLAKESCGKFSSRPSIVSLYYRTFGEMKRKDVLLKIEAHTEKIFISYDAIRVYFKPYSFEVKR